MKTKEEVNINPKPMFYACILEGLRRIALECGYALAMHGTCASDLDLIAVRWSKEYEPPETLVNRFGAELSKYYFGEDYVAQITNPEHRYLNQMHYSIPIIGDWYIDLTIIEDEKSQTTKS